MKNKWDKETLINVVNNSINKIDVLKKLNLKSFTGNYDTLNRYLKKYNIDTSHFKRITDFKNLNHIEIPLYNILVSGSTYANNVKLKNRLYKKGLKEPICEECGQDENWRGKHMSLILDHINGIHDDNRIENLRIVCPNCNATLPTHCGKNIKNKKIKIDKKKIKKENICSCGKKINRHSKKCLNCHNKNNRKTERPSYEQLQKDIIELGYSTTGRKYGVSDNAIRKWIKFYEK